MRASGPVIDQLINKYLIDWLRDYTKGVCNNSTVPKWRYVAQYNQVSAASTQIYYVFFYVNMKLNENNASILFLARSHPKLSLKCAKFMQIINQSVKHFRATAGGWNSSWLRTYPKSNFSKLFAINYCRILSHCFRSRAKRTVVTSLRKW